MKLVAALLVSLAVFGSGAARAAETCQAQATTKKLNGAAKTSFVKKCERDAKVAGASSACEAKAIERKLAGAAKTSFVKKCNADAATPPAAAASK